MNAMSTHADAESFRRAYKELTGKDVLPGREAKVMQIASQSYEGSTVFGVCTVRWTVFRGRKWFTISTDD